MRGFAPGKEFYAGAIFTAIGLAAGFLSTQYELGTPTAMGPGYFPLVLSIVLTALGIGAMGVGLAARRAEPVGAWALAPLGFVTAGVIAFGLLIDRKGLVPACLVLIVLGCCQRLRRSALEVALIALVLIGMAVGLFIYGLGMPMKMFD
jgi:hypothetical protein